MAVVLVLSNALSGALGVGQAVLLLVELQLPHTLTCRNVTDVRRQLHLQCRSHDMLFRWLGVISS